MVRGLWLLPGFLLPFMFLACAKQQPASARLSNAEIEGEWLYDNNCAECHENPQLDLHKQPPSLHGLFRRGSLPSGAPATAAQIRTTIIQGRGTMPAFDQRLREEDVDNLLRYLRTLH